MQICYSIRKETQPRSVRISRDGAMSEMLEGEKLTLETKTGEMIELIPAK